MLKYTVEHSVERMNW